MIKTKKSYGLLCAEIVADEFPNGIHTNSKEEITRLRTALEAKYGKLDVPKMIDLLSVEQFLILIWFRREDLLI